MEFRAVLRIDIGIHVRHLEFGEERRTGFTNASAETARANQDSYQPNPFERPL
jgi:hypothetical protein